MNKIEKLKQYAFVLDKWAESLPLSRVYIYGSRVRGDERGDSDIDIAFDIERYPSIEATDNWTRQNQTNFKDLREKFDECLDILHPDDFGVLDKLRKAAIDTVPLSVGKVVCIIIPSHKA